MSDKIRVLFLCLGNSCRSQMAEGLLRHLGGHRFEAFSAGTVPSYVHPRVIQVMDESGIDVSNHRSKHVQEFTGQEFDFVISLCGVNNCPSFVGKTGASLHWPFPDPVGATGSEEDLLDGFRKLRDGIKSRIEDFVADPDSFKTSGPDIVIR
ncbi:arsenate reductase ArsC [candidate division WOR-3 bacterium]|nr:arsenate reductase ArsC [candidate division WOR-3 bacterium]